MEGTHLVLSHDSHFWLATVPLYFLTCNISITSPPPHYVNYRREKPLDVAPGSTISDWAYADVYSILRDKRPGLCVELYSWHSCRACASLLQVVHHDLRPACGSRPLGHSLLTLHQVRINVRYMIPSYFAINLRKLSTLLYGFPISSNFVNTALNQYALFPILFLTHEILPFTKLSAISSAIASLLSMSFTSFFHSASIRACDRPYWAALQDWRGMRLCYQVMPSPSYDNLTV